MHRLRYSEVGSGRCSALLNRQVAAAFGCGGQACNAMIYTLYILRQVISLATCMNFNIWVEF